MCTPFVLQLYLWIYNISITIESVSVFMNKLFKQFISLECICNRLQFAIRICQRELCRQMLCIATSLYFRNKIYTLEIYLEWTPCSQEQKRFRVFSSKHWGVCIHLSRCASTNVRQNMEEMHLWEIRNE